MTKGMTILAAMLVLLLSVVAEAQEFYNKHRWGVVTDEEWAAEPPEEFANVGLVILRQDQRYAAFKNSYSQSFKCYWHVRIKVMNAAGAEEAGQFMIPYAHPYENYGGFKAQTITPDGKIHKVKGKHIEKIKEGGMKFRVIQFPAVEPGCIIEYRFRVSSQGAAFLDDWYAQNKYFVIRSTLEVLLPRKSSYRVDSILVEPYITYTNVELNTWQKAYSSRRCNRFTWVVENVPPMEKEPLSDPRRNFRPRLEFEDEDLEWPLTWAEVGANWWEYLDKSVGESPPFKALADSLTVGMKSAEEKSRALYRYVQNELVTITLDESKKKEHETLVQALRAGEATIREKNVMLAFLHKQLGIPAWWVGLARGYAYELKHHIALPWVFNYIIVKVQLEGTVAFLDAGASGLPYGLLDPDCLEMRGLQFSSQFASLIDIPVSDVTNRRIDTTFVSVVTDGPAECRVKTVFTGYPMGDASILLQAAEPTEMVNATLLTEVSNPDEPSDVATVRDGDKSLAITYSYQLGDMFSEFDGNLLARHIHYRLGVNPFKRKTRYSEVYFRYPIQLSSTTVYKIDPAYHEVLLPADTTIHLENHLTFLRHSEHNDSTVVVTTTLDINKYRYPVAEYAGVRQFFDQMALIVSEEVVLINGTEEDDESDITGE